MATVSTPSGFSTFENGDRLSRADFHRIYENMSEDYQAELVGGIELKIKQPGIDHRRRRSQTYDCGNVLPDFVVHVKDLFAELDRIETNHHTKM